jgi:NAD(P)H-hydrate epimerase
MFHRSFRTPDGLTVPAITAKQMRDVDRTAAEDFGLGILQMMEKAGRSLAQNALDMLSSKDGVVFGPNHWLPLERAGTVQR